MTDDLHLPIWLTDDTSGALEDREGPAPWRIHSDREAAWAFRKMRALVAERDRLEDLYAEELDRIKTELAAAVGPTLRNIEFFESKLIDYRRRLEELSAERGEELPKTYRVPGGKLTRRQQPEAIVVHDEQAFTAWALEHGALDFVKVEPSKSALKDLSTTPDGRLIADEESGEVIPGVARERGDDKYGASLA